MYMTECSNILHEFCVRKTRGQEPFVIPYISIPELSKYISKLDNKKSSGPDGISNHLLKLSPPYIIDSLTYIFNLCTEKNHYPSEFKKAKVIPLPKTRDKTNLTDYRPISLLICPVQTPRKACACTVKWLFGKTPTHSPLPVWFSM